MCSADGKIRLATLELSCLLLKQQVVTSTGCIIKDVHLACLEVRASPHPVPVSCCHWESDREAGVHGTTEEKLGPSALTPAATYLSPQNFPSVGAGSMSPLN